MYKEKYLKYKNKYMLKCELMNNPTNDTPVLQKDTPVLQKDGNAVILDSFSYNSNSATIVDGKTHKLMMVYHLFGMKHLKMKRCFMK